MLREVATILKHSSRPTDLVARWGGEEFLLIFTRATPEAAQQVCERMRLAIAGHDWSHLAAGLAVTISFGLSDLRKADTYEALLAAADAQLYAAKQNGRNRVEPST